jgi:hypothetical protein
MPVQRNILNASMPEPVTAKFSRSMHLNSIDVEKLSRWTSKGCKDADNSEKKSSHGSNERLSSVLLFYCCISNGTGFFLSSTSLDRSLPVLSIYSHIFCVHLA